jgi:hypothetical protein
MHVGRLIEYRKAPLPRGTTMLKWPAGQGPALTGLQVNRRREAGPEGRGSGLLDNVAIWAAPQVDTVAEDAAALTEPAVDEHSRPAKKSMRMVQ